MFDFDYELTTKLDFSTGCANKKNKDLLELEILFLDEISMIDIDAWEAMSEILGLADHSRRPDAPADDDPFGNVAVVLFGDFKQLPPATSKPPFVVVSWVVECFSFRVLRQNRRVVAGDASRAEELEEFRSTKCCTTLATETQLTASSASSCSAMLEAPRWAAPNAPSWRAQHLWRRRDGYATAGIVPSCDA